MVGNAAARRRRRAGQRLDRGDELVALPVHGADDRLAAAVVVDGLAHGLDPRRERGFADEAVAPDRVEQFFLAHNGAAPLHEIRQDVERFGFELDVLAVTAQDDAIQIQLARCEPQNHPVPHRHPFRRFGAAYPRRQRKWGDLPMYRARVLRTVDTTATPTSDRGEPQ